MRIKLLFDQNLSYRLLRHLETLYPGSRHIASLNMDCASDYQVWQYAKENAFTLVTKDSDFNDLSILHGFPPHVIWLRLGNSRISVAKDALINYFDEIKRIIEEGKEGIIEIEGA